MHVKFSIFMVSFTTIIEQCTIIGIANSKQTRMTTKRTSRNQMINIDKYRVAANIKEYHIVSKLIFMVKAIISCKKLYKIVKNQHLSSHHIEFET